MTCCTPACFAASAIPFASAYSFSGEKWAQKNVTQKAPYAPANARFTPSTSFKSAATTSAPKAANSFALSECTSRVNARAIKPPLVSPIMARTKPPPCNPVAPTTAMILFSAMIIVSHSYFPFGTGLTDCSHQRHKPLHGVASRTHTMGCDKPHRFPDTSAFYLREAQNEKLTH